MVVTSGQGVRIVGEYGRGVSGLSLLRRDLDWLLIEQAIAAGVQFEPGVVVQRALIDTSGEQRVAGLSIRTARAEHSLRAPLTIAADGRRSRLTFGLGLSRHPRRPRRWAIGSYFDGVNGSGGLGEMHIRDGAYIGVAPVPGGLTNACVVVSDPTPHALADPSALLLTTLRGDRILADRFHAARMEAPPVVIGPLAVDATGACLAGLLTVGDAAGFIDPMTGDGLRFAFRGAELAANVVVESGGISLANAQALATQRQREFRGKWRMNRALRAVVASPAAVSCVAVAARICPPIVRQLIALAGDARSEARG
jgi:flavin-dependent dehydrogenase